MFEELLVAVSALPQALFTSGWWTVLLVGSAWLAALLASP
jgi:hypothetical protein